jgi:glycosyltransferase involved in cell wall biosynthesis
MNVVIVDGDVSYPATSGKRLRTLHLMLPLARRHRITYIGRCAPNSVEMREAPEFLRDHNIEPILVPDPVPRKSGLSFYTRLACNLVSALPYSVSSHRSVAMKAAVADAARHRLADLWQFEWTAYQDMLDPAIPGARVVVAHNVDTLIWKRWYEKETRPFHRWFLKGQWRKFEAFERRAFQEADRVIAVSPDDADLVRSKFLQPNVDVVENGIDRAFFEQAQGTREPHTVLFLGALDWRPNLDAVDLLLGRIFPELHRLQPQAKLWIVGRNPPPGLVERARGMSGVELHANVPDVRKYLAESAVMAVPLRVGGGSRLKILEALACGLPVVSTRIGAEGLDLTPGEHFVEAEEHEMAGALASALADPWAMRRQADAGRARVLAHYDWESLALKQEQAWRTCVEEYTHDRRREPTLAS